MNNGLNLLGIDAGSVSIAVAEVDRQGNIIKTSYRFHQGKIAETLENMLLEYDLNRISHLAATTSTPEIITIDRRYDNRIAMLTTAQKYFGNVGALLIVGGERFGLMTFDHRGDYLDFKANTSCAAGTGGFLDQQAKRLGLTGIQQLSDLADANTAPIPSIASRCAVFAKTDLVHAQQEGYTLSEICDGLCYGLAKTIVEILLKNLTLQAPVVFTGGVAQNKAVVRHLQTLIGMNLVTNKYSAEYGAIGAALSLISDTNLTNHTAPIDPKSLQIHHKPVNKHYYPPLSLSLSDYPDFQSLSSWLFYSNLDNNQAAVPVEVDFYTQPTETGLIPVYLGIDIGSTSTKAILVDSHQQVISGFYTRTMGRPIQAVMQIFSAIEDFCSRQQLNIHFIGVGVTGSGRKFIGKIIQADLVVDEITAHARAAFELNPTVDTIIEIGGQDAKFTSMRNGMVTFSVMNTVCAAGTGSFIEEQAERLGCPLSEYSARAEHQTAPLASDRCTVFMERDLNHYLACGYSPNEILAAALHAVRENYLSKVAVMSAIGNTITFQGATAKNKALAAAFESRLKKPIHVSRYCHLTGALGLCLTMIDSRITRTSFRGIKLYRQPIPIQSEICQLCTNNCKITIARINNELIAFGFLCGRDYDTQQFVDNNRSGFNLLKQRKSIVSHHFTPVSDSPTIGIPAALHLYEDLSFWQHFFHELGFRTITSQSLKHSIKQGKHIAGAEFCAPLMAFHSHVNYCIHKADYVFVPIYLEQKGQDLKTRRLYCYYTQYAPSLVANAETIDSQKLLMPLVHYIFNDIHLKTQLYKMLNRQINRDISFRKVAAAYHHALDITKQHTAALKELYRQESTNLEDIHVVLLGRPYSVLDKTMNKNIPEIFASQGIKAFFQDMLPIEEIMEHPDFSDTNALPWYYAATIMTALQFIAGRKGCYPVLITSFKCTPDAFVTEYFKNTLDKYRKPYLILQLDEHDSSVGYETRIEAAIRSFRNHFHNVQSETAFHLPEICIPRKQKHLGEKTVLIPNWDQISLSLLVANLNTEGVDARLLEQTDSAMRESLSYNSGQCIPLNIITQQYIDYIKKYDLDPAKTCLWAIDSSIACNLTMFPQYIKTLLVRYGQGMEKSDVYTGTLFFQDISAKMAINNFFAYMFGGLLRKIGCRIRPYEINAGQTDLAMETALNLFLKAFVGKISKEDAAAEAVSLFQRIPIQPMTKPKVAIFGDLYARDNESLNQNLIRYIENNGGEVITTPYSSFAKMISQQYLRKWLIEGKYKEMISSKALIAVQQYMEQSYNKYFNRLLGPEPTYDEPAEKILSEYYIRREHTGESMDNIIKIYYLAKHYPDLSLLVQTNPAFCCPSLITEAMTRKIQQKIQVPIVSITYDGTGSFKNDIIIPYLRYPRYGKNGHDQRRSPRIMK